MGQRSADRVPLEVLENRMVRCLLALDHHVDDRMETRGPRQRGAELALLDDDRTGKFPAVEDTRHQPLLAEAADTTRPDLLGGALGDGKRDAVARHRRTIVAEAG